MSPARTPTTGSLTSDQVRAIDRYAIEKLGIPGVVLMENAGRNAADAVVGLLADLTVKAHGGGVRSPSAAIVAGAGNNGGDGFVVARHLAMRGLQVSVFLVADPAKVGGDAATNFNIIQKLRLDIRPMAGRTGELAASLADFDVIIDAVGGTGIHGPLRGDMAGAVEQINAAARPVVAIDIPTGLDCDTGHAAGPAVKAAITVTVAAMKKGFDAPGAAAYTGKVLLADIGIDAERVAAVAQAESGAAGAAAAKKGS